MSSSNLARIVELQGAYNLRDLGGYPAEGGMIAWGRVYRGGTLARLTDQDHAVLERLDIHTVCDLRTSRERHHRPSRLPEGARPARWSRDYDMSSADLIDALAHPSATAAAARDRMIDLYRFLAYEQAASYAALFRMIGDGALPILFHCSAGKDRTGIAAALLLDVLGVARETVIEDYLITEQFFEQGCAMLRDEPTSARLLTVHPEIWKPLMQAERAYIEEMFRTIEDRHGSARGFLREALDLTETEIDRLAPALVVAYPSGDMVSPPSTNSSAPVM